MKSYITKMIKILRLSCLLVSITVLFKLMSCSAWIFKIPNELFVARMVHCSTLLQSQPTKLLVMGVNPLYSCVRTNRLTLQQPGPIIVRTSLHQNQPQSKTLSASALMRNLWQSGRLFYGVKCLFVNSGFVMLYTNECSWEFI